MEIWIGGGRVWKKKPFKRFPAPMPLVSLLIEHQREDFKTDHWIVFTKEEEKAILNMSAPFYPSQGIGGRNFLEVICGFLKEMFLNPPYVTCVPIRYEKPLGKQRGYRLAVRFNQKL
jgi:hypothetical protein